AYWKTLPTDEGATFDKSVTINAADVVPTVTWGTSPEDVIPVSGHVPDPESFADPSKQDAARKSLEYMGLSAGQAMNDVAVEKIFSVSRSNGRIEDLPAAAEVLSGRNKADGVNWATVVLGSGLVNAQAEAEGLDVIFNDSELERREP